MLAGSSELAAVTNEDAPSFAWPLVAHAPAGQAQEGAWCGDATEE
jgi:hypothetical protein